MRGHQPVNTCRMRSSGHKPAGRVFLTYTSGIFVEGDRAGRFAYRLDQLLNPTHSLWLQEHVTAYRTDLGRDVINHDDLPSMSKGMDNQPLFVISRACWDTAFHPPLLLPSSPSLMQHHEISRYPCL